MNKMFGTKIKINYATGPAMGSIGNQLLAEFKANRPSATDVYFGNGPYAIPLIDAGMLTSVNWPALLPGRITPSMDDAARTLGAAPTRVLARGAARHATL